MEVRLVAYPWDCADEQVKESQTLMMSSWIMDNNWIVTIFSRFIIPDSFLLFRIV